MGGATHSGSIVHLQAASPDYAQGKALGWARMVRADDVNVVRANQYLKQAIAGGATGVAVVFEGAHNAFGFGLPARTGVISRLFEGINLDGLHLRLDNHPHGAALSNQFIEFLQQNHINPQQTKITFGIDMTATLAACGKLKMSLAALKASLPQSMSAFFSSGLPGVVLEADGRVYHHAGASRAQELGAMLGVADEHLQMIQIGRHPVIHALPHIGFATALDGDFCSGLVKLQALQHLWQRLQTLHGIENPLPATIHVETSRRMLSRHDMALNTARSHCSAMAAIAGGAVSLSLLPSETSVGLSNEKARRRTLTVQMMLALENTGLDRLRMKINLEKEVEALSERAWQHYQYFTRKGGVMGCLMDGSLAQQFIETYERHPAPGNRAEDELVADLAVDIHDEAPLHLEIEGVNHCRPLTPVYRDD